MISFRKFLCEEVPFDKLEQSERGYYEESLKVIPNYYKKITEIINKIPNMDKEYRSIAEFSSAVKELAKFYESKRKLCASYESEFKKLSSSLHWNTLENLYNRKRKKDSFKELKDLLDMKKELDKIIVNYKYDNEKVDFYNIKLNEIIKANNATKKIKNGTSSEEAYNILKKYGFYHDVSTMGATRQIADCYANMYVGKDAIAFCYLGMDHSFLYGKIYSIKNNKVSNIKEHLVVDNKLNQRKIENLHDEFEKIQPLGSAAKALLAYYDNNTWTGD